MLGEPGGDAPHIQADTVVIGEPAEASGGGEAAALAAGVEVGMAAGAAVAEASQASEAAAAALADLEALNAKLDRVAALALDTAHRVSTFTELLELADQLATEDAEAAALASEVADASAVTEVVEHEPTERPTADSSEPGEPGRGESTEPGASETPARQASEKRRPATRQAGYGSPFRRRKQ